MGTVGPSLTGRTSSLHPLERGWQVTARTHTWQDRQDSPDTLEISGPLEKNRRGNAIREMMIMIKKASVLSVPVISLVCLFSNKNE
jgi:hypothetical protein